MSVCVCESWGMRGALGVSAPRTRGNYFIAAGQQEEVDSRVVYGAELNGGPIGGAEEGALQQGERGVNRDAGKHAAGRKEVLAEAVNADAGTVRH